MKYAKKHLRNGGREQAPVHWWCNEVQKTRKQCLTAKKKVVRGNRMNIKVDKKEELKKSYVEKRKDLSREINKAKT